MNQKHPNHKTILAALVLVVLFCAEVLPAQTAAPPASAPTVPADPTAATIPPAKFNIQDLVEQPKFAIGSPLLLGTGLASTLAGTILCLYSGSIKTGYDTAYALWKLDPNATTLAARDQQFNTFLVPLLIGGGLDVLGIILTIAGFDQGTGIKNLSPVAPKAMVDPVPAAQAGAPGSPGPGTSPVPANP